MTALASEGNSSRKRETSTRSSQVPSPPHGAHVGDLPAEVLVYDAGIVLVDVPHLEYADEERVVVGGRRG